MTAKEFLESKGISYRRDVKVFSSPLDCSHTLKLANLLDEYANQLESSDQSSDFKRGFDKGIELAGEMLTKANQHMLNQHKEENSTKEEECKYCGNTKALHSEATELCPDRFKHFEAK